ncbi:MAG: hypothetical protein CMJ25_04420 [Phycisphaerae bacterium]|jgi:hypothetical protein|nr:hypothetical protein [Phycisphaerae bacterium]|tara:strand:- start:181 stop:414 length:234 start_codon:yes stop_codon:yes gene_type:complete
MTKEELLRQLDREERISEFYYLAINDIDRGHPIQELYNALKLYEAEEDYEACAGIKKAIKEAEHKTLKDIKHGNRFD